MLRHRKDADIVRTLGADRESFSSDTEFFAACRSKVFQAAQLAPGHRPVPDGAGHEEAENEGDSWTLNVAKRLWQVCHSLRSDLMHERIINLLVEWCETDRADSSCVAYADTCVEYLTDHEQSDRILRHKDKSPSNNCYIYIPHPLLDPVLEAHREKLCEFYSHTFWANKDVFLCCQAALALAKRGVNVDRFFIGESPPGGVPIPLFFAPGYHAGAQPCLL